MHTGDIHVFVSDLVLRKLCKQYSYNIGSEGIVLFAVRGALPELCLKNRPNKAGRPQFQLKLTETRVNYRHPGCSIGIWWTDTGKVSLYPGSTVPSLDYLHQFPDSTGHFNVLLPGKYNLVKGIHPKEPSGYGRHIAFMMMGEGWVFRPEVVRKRTRSYFNSKRIFYQITYPGDNLHASRAEPDTQAGLIPRYTDYLRKSFSSSGCMTIIGQPEEYIKTRKIHYFWNSWQQFIEMMDISAPHTNSFSFLLLNHDDFTGKDKDSRNHVLRFGASGNMVTELQQILADIYSVRLSDTYYTGSIDGHLLAGTAKAYLEFLKDFSPSVSMGEISLTDFRKKTRHFVFTFKQPKHVIN